MGYPCVPIFIATYNPDEGEISPHFSDRMAISLSTDMNSLSLKQRVEVVYNVINFSGDVEERMKDQSEFTETNARLQDEELRTNISNGRQNLSKVRMSNEQILYLCEEASRAGCEGQRAEIYATHIAKASAALDGRVQVNVQDLETGIFFAILPRSKFILENKNEPTSADEDMQSVLTSFDDVAPFPQPQNGMEEERAQEEETEQDKMEQIEQDNQSQEQADETQNEEEEFEIPTQFMFGVDMVPIDPNILNLAQLTRKGEGGKRSKLYNLERGKYVKPIFPRGEHRGKIAVGATLRAAAPFQISRRSRAQGTKREHRAVFVQKDDFRIKRMTRKSGALIVFVVDASGSMALNRMDAAKGAAISLTSEAYKARDKVCLISYHDRSAEVIVPPTRSTTVVKRRLEEMPCGGGSPLTHALTLAAKVALNEKKIKKDCGKVFIILLTDGRANVPMCVSMGEQFDPLLYPSIDGRPTKKFLREEVITFSRTLATLDFNMIVIDTEDPLVATGIGRQIATAARGTYYRLDPRDVITVKEISEGVQKSNF